MRRNCNLELRLVPFSDSDHYLYHQQPIKAEEACTESPQQQQQQLTIFYNGTVCVWDVTEIQARAILAFAKQEMEEKVRTSGATGSGGHTSPILPSPLCSPGTPAPALSMNRSLRRFLQKRQHRIQATSPYNQTH